MFNIAICDDEKIMCEIVKESLDDYAKLRGLDLRYDVFHSGRDLLGSSKKYDLIMLDYMLEESGKANGIAVAQSIRSTDEDVVIIFLSGHPRKAAIPAFEVGALRFLPKPLKKHKFYEALDKFVKEKTKAEKTLIIRIDGESILIEIKHILYVEGYGKYCIIHTKSRRYECHETMLSIEKRLPPEFFVRCHKSFLVSIRHVASFTSTCITLTNRSEVSVSRDKYKVFQSAYLDFHARHL